MDKMQIISNYVRQSYDIFNTFGRKPETLENICLGFYQVLQGFDNSHIKRAFDYWLENNSNMPTPADIRSKCKDYQRWEKESLETKGLPKPRMLESKRPNKIVSWYCVPAEVFNQNRDSYIPEMKDHKKLLISEKGVEHAKSYFNQFLSGYLKYNISFEEL